MATDAELRACHDGMNSDDIGIVLDKHFEALDLQMPDEVFHEMLRMDDAIFNDGEIHPDSVRGVFFFAAVIAAYEAGRKHGDENTD